jgi:hypothetical protein
MCRRTLELQLSANLAALTLCGRQNFGSYGLRLLYHAFEYVTLYDKRGFADMINVTNQLTL